VDEFLEPSRVPRPFRGHGQAHLASLAKRPEVRVPMLSWRIDRSLPITVLELAGELRLGTVQNVRAALLKCLAECPTAVVVDLSRVAIRSEIALTVFGAVMRQAVVWPPVPLVLVSTEAETRATTDRVCRPWRIAVCGSRDEALDLALLGNPPAERIGLRLRPGTMALPQVRSMVADACLDWGIADLVLPAELIMTELVSNAIQHARTDLEASVALRRTLLHLMVADGSPAPPRKSVERPPVGALSGRGLLLVNEFATAWGSLPIAGGKVVWATLRVSG
jgi:anti-anti-sigma regulatory factor